MNLKTFFTLILCSIVALPGFAQNNNQITKFSEWDMDEDDKIERYEFVSTFTQEYADEWGITEEVVDLDEEAFYTTTYAIADTDDDETISEDEWDFAYRYYFGDYLMDDYAMYDTDGDSQFEYVEYYDALYDSDYFDTWDVDRDGKLDKHELAYAIFDNWDLNDNGVLDKSEFNSFSTFYLDI